MRWHAVWITRLHSLKTTTFHLALYFPSVLHPLLWAQLLYVHQIHDPASVFPLPKSSLLGHDYLCDIVLRLNLEKIWTALSLISSPNFFLSLYSKTWTVCTHSRKYCWKIPPLRGPSLSAACRFYVIFAVLAQWKKPVFTTTTESLSISLSVSFSLLYIHTPHNFIRDLLSYN